MKRIKLLGAALIFAAATALAPASSPALTCDASQCFNLNCSQTVCPAGQFAFPMCNLQYCTFHCGCRSRPTL
jgi:hypothetical protein